jgi:CubicO group peptidase (beta-lactamase class C family)
VAARVSAAGDGTGRARRAALVDSTADGLGRLIAQAQKDWRSASVVASVVRDGVRVFDRAVGSAEVDTGSGSVAPGPDTLYRIGSITKTFTAVLVLALRDQGRLALEDPLSAHIPGTRHGDISIRQMLTHLSGLQREPVGDVWYTLEAPDRGELLLGLEMADAVLPRHRRLHYSNLAFALLGEVVSRLEGEPWEQSLRTRILDPLGMTRTMLEPEGTRAVGYFTDPFADLVHREPDLATRALAPAAQLWSTTADLGRWAAFIADPVAEVLSPDTVEEMCHPHVMYDVDAWNLAWGLGFMLLRSGDRVLVGHEGAMPGFLAGLYVRRPDSVGAVVFANTSSGAQPGELAADLVTTVLDAEPTPPEPWIAGPPVDPAAADLLGIWWSEASEFVFSWTEGRLRARLRAPSAAARPPAVFVREGEDRWRTESGREAGEELRVVRDGAGAVVRMHWATYAFTREPIVFGGGPMSREGR